MKQTFDSPWKEVLGFYFRQFMEYCCPDIANEIDWEKNYELLDKELAAINKDAETGDLEVDKLIKVWLKDGNEIWVLIHIEVQAEQQAHFAERMYIYNYRLFDKFRKPIFSLAILGDNNKNWRPDRYEQVLWNCTVDFKFPIIKLLDYQAKRAELATTTNPFGIVFLAHLIALETKHNNTTRLYHKTALTRQLIGRNVLKEEISGLYYFIDWVLALPKDMELQYHKEVKKIDEGCPMRYITSIERIGMEMGLEQGMQQGMQQERILLLISLLRQKFNEVPLHYHRLIEKADFDILLVWLSNLLKAQTIDDVFSGAV